MITTYSESISGDFKITPFQDGTGALIRGDSLMEINAGDSIMLCLQDNKVINGVLSGFILDRNTILIDDSTEVNINKIVYVAKK